MLSLMTDDRRARTRRTRLPACARWLGVFMLLCVGALWSQAALAACPASYSITVNAGQSGTINVYGCFPFGINPPTSPSSGTVTYNNTAGANNVSVTYTNTVTSATTDTFQITDGSITRTVNVTINPPVSSITISPTALTLTGGTSVNQSFTASGGTGPYSFAVTSGALPTGLSLSSGGVLSGTPTAYGAYSFTVTATDSSGTPQTGSQSFTGSVSPGTLYLTPGSTSTSTSTTLTAAIITVPYSLNFSGSGGVTPYTYGVTDPGNLPPGITLSGNTLSGTPTATGTYNFHVSITDSETDASGASTTNTWVYPYSLTVQPPPTITVSPSTLSAATAGATYTSTTFSASGGTAPYYYAVTTGNLPPGMNLSGSGTLSGKPTAGGTFNFTVTATDAHGFKGAQAETLTVNPAIIMVSTSSLPSTATVGQTYSGTVTASGGTPPYAYTVAAGALPPGMTLSSSGTLSGKPTAGGSYQFAITATDHSTGTGPYSGTSSTFTLTVNAPTITITPSTLPSATDGSAYSQALSASGGTAPYTYQKTFGTLPSGITLSSGGQLSGTPSGSGTYNFSVTAYDSSTGSGSPYTGTKSYTLVVAATAPVANAVSANVAYDSTANPITLNITGGTPTSVAIASQASHGTATASGTSITYTPTAGYTGTDSFTYTASNSAGTSAPATVSITVSGPTLAITSSSGGTSLTATVGQSFTQTFTFSGGQAPYQGYSISGIPAGLSVTAFDSTSITISGTPTVSGTFTLNVSGTDSSTGTDPSSGKNAPFTISKSFTLQISPASMSVSPASGALPGATAGVAYNQLITAGGGISPYTYTITSGALPSGVILTAAGILKGTPTAAGTFQFQVTAIDSSTGAGSPATASATYTLAVVAPTIAITPGTLPGASTNTPYSQALSASGGTASYTYAVTSGSLPAGMTLSSTGALTGTPTATGSSSFTVTATDSLGFTGSQSYTLNVSVGAPVANAVSASVAYDSTANPITLNITGGTPTSVAVATQASHGTATASGASITYTPTAGYAGSDSFTYTASNSGGTSAPATVSITVLDPTLNITASGSLSTAVGQSYTQTFTFSGGAAPYSGFNITGVPAGLSVTGFNSTSITLSGTPTASGTFQLTVKGTDSSTGNGPFSVQKTFTLNIAVATLTISPSTLPGATAGTAYNQVITTTSGISPYTYTVTSGALPAGLSLSASGILSGTPTVAGSFNFSITSTDSSTGAGSPATVTQSYTLAVAAPTITISPSTLPGAYTQAAYSQTLAASGGTASYTYAVTSGSLPAGMTLSSTGALTGTPTATGSSSFTVKATDSLGFTGSQAYNLTVSLGAPVANPDTATTPSQSAVTIPVTGNDNGTIDSIAIASAPSNGTATVNGTSVLYTPTGTFYGTDTFTYTATNSAGTSAPATVTVTVTPLPAPTVSNQTLRVLGGQSVSIDATAGATGGPYTSAAIVTAPSVGTATVSGTTITYRAAATASGTDTFTYTLSNAYGTSSAATVTLTLIPRPDPTRDAEVMGVLNAQAESARRFMRGQIDNFQSRLESLHGGGSAAMFQNNLSATFGGGRRGMMHGPASIGGIDMNRDGLDGPNGHVLSARAMPGTQDAHASDESGGHGFTLWASGALNFGTQKIGTSHNGIDFNTSGLTLGGDTRVSDHLALGGGVGYGHDASDVGKNGSRSTADAYNVAGYLSYRPSDTTFVDGVLGYQWLSFDSHRYVTVDGNFVDGSRNGTQVFGSLSAGFDHQRGTMRVSPYGRVDAARARLDAYTEQGDALYALHYDRQTIQTTTGALGLRLDWSFKRDFGLLQPMLRVEYRHDFQGSSDTTMQYADMIGPLYRATVGDLSRNHTLLGLGLQTQNTNGLRFRIEYQNMFESSTSSDQSILLHLEWPFH